MRATKRFPFPGQYARSSGGTRCGTVLHTIWKIGGVPMLIFESDNKVDVDSVYKELLKAKG
jgi:hypothetical protein